MKPRSSYRFLLAAFAAAALAAADLPAGAAGATVEGRWRLVDQTVGRGKTEPAGGPPELRLEFSRADGTLGGRVWISDREGRAVEWPTLFVDHEPAPVRVVQRLTSESGDRVLARYEVRDPGDALVTLEVTEDYRLTDDGAALVGTVTVRQLHDGKDAGQYVLRRRFARER